MDTNASNRRPLRSRSSRWASAAAANLAATSITPNQISVASVAFAGLGAWALLQPAQVWPLLLCALCVQLRLLCNLMDGMVAVEGGKQSPVGGLYNEIPDRIADSLLIVALGYAGGIAWLGWCGALLAAVTAYIRTLGGALGLPQDFRGPMAKQQRMAVLTAACLFAMAENSWGSTHYSLPAALWIIAVGSLVTCGTRTQAIGRALRERSGAKP